MKLNIKFKDKKTRLSAIVIFTFIASVVIVAIGTTILCDSIWCRIFPWQNTAISGFEECVSLGYPVAESYPRRCLTPNGSFVEDIKERVVEPEINIFSDENIKVTAPVINAVIISPLEIKGEARGTWYFEASFPVRLVDSENNIIVQSHAEALSDWMTTEFVPFSLRLDFVKPATPTGFLVLEKDNPSGLPENAKEIKIPVRFNQ